MKRQIVMSEKELDIIINRALWAGFCLHRRHPFSQPPETQAWKEMRDKERELLKATHKSTE